ncbi:hypothetical protein FIBSPDRAFT_876832 [Athelia psychrophila]|uniref:Uncharacterized protein n=1 Tax=Athelia psychrophila TaxID=1759441 RepID=A0A167WGX5_9AGAM|nr:hypothetical protein FIBSPDRAFT_876832 [Fibularhizoctonia sp. CBS 109695]
MDKPGKVPDIQWCRAIRSDSGNLALGRHWLIIVCSGHHPWDSEWCHPDKIETSYTQGSVLRTGARHDSILRLEDSDRWLGRHTCAGWATSSACMLTVVPIRAFERPYRPWRLQRVRRIFTANCKLGDNLAFQVFGSPA